MRAFHHFSSCGRIFYVFITDALHIFLYCSMFFHIFWMFSRRNACLKTERAAVNAGAAGPGVRRVRAEGRSLVLCLLFRLALVVAGYAPRGREAASLPSLARVLPWALARGSRLVHAACMVLYTPPHDHTSGAAYVYVYAYVLVFSLLLLVYTLRVPYDCGGGKHPCCVGPVVGLPGGCWVHGELISFHECKRRKAWSIVSFRTPLDEVYTVLAHSEKRER